MKKEKKDWLIEFLNDNVLIIVADDCEIGDNTVILYKSNSIIGVYNLRAVRYISLANFANEKK